MLVKSSGFVELEKQSVSEGLPDFGAAITGVLTSRYAPVGCDKQTVFLVCRRSRLVVTTREAANCEVIGLRRHTGSSRDLVTPYIASFRTPSVNLAWLDIPEFLVPISPTDFGYLVGEAVPHHCCTSPIRHKRCEVWARDRVLKADLRCLFAPVTTQTSQRSKGIKCWFLAGKRANGFKSGRK